ncbi:MAG: endonuclease/exonuclease/phosphatase family protein [Chitinophagales bacterium]|nr:endonuclease/exonuclease/phosphatase family protein [Chitinophagales bacterium]
MIRALLRNTMLSVNGVVAVLLLASKYSGIISPEAVWWLAFVGILFPLFLVLNLSFVLFWLLNRKPYFIVSLLALIFCWTQIRSFISFSGPTTIPNDAVSIMTYNVKNFDLYNWSHNAETRHKIFSLIKRENPDIICFQEFYSQDTAEHKNQVYLKDSLGYGYSFFNKTFTRHYNSKKHGLIDLHWGLAIFSKFPIRDTGTVDFSNALSNNCQWADVEVKGKTVRVFNTHLQSIHLGYDDYNTIEEIEEEKTASWFKVKNILRKFKNAYVKRALQVAQINAATQLSTVPVIVCGDFNDQPISYSYHKLSNGLVDAFIAKGNGIGATFVNKFNFFRIDYLLFSPSLPIHSYSTIRENYSDHYPVVVRFGIEKQ